MRRPYVLLSAAVSVDGFLDDASSHRLVLSNDEDFDRVDEVRAGVDAILVGANTIRADNPRLLIRDEKRRQARIDRDLPPDPVKVTLTGTGGLDPEAAFFTAGETEKLIYTNDAAAVSERLGAVATVVEAAGLDAVLADLADRGIRRLMVEGGGRIHTMFLTAGVVDELQIVFAPFFVGDAGAPRLVGPGRFPQNPANPMLLAETRQLGDVVLLRYLIGQAARDFTRLREAAELAESSPPSPTFRVGAIVTDEENRVLATGYSGETDPHDHAEEAALAKLAPGDPRLARATLYSSLEPCSSRASRELSCTQHILRAGIPRVVFAWREPDVFVHAEGAEQLRAAGREVVELPELAPLVRHANAHLV
ncbi:dihydrofolate reductase family protein [Amycolatopsis taiwanensis]|uniref:Riboflavin biosynthesis protein RibD n=1 Tax=Amycolatopsis taiwanensis TaxID=342230 RepID=A0A9W6R077_9PSEU|nr:dihydrofolate reductase family protein [Amycolatopsis taiwanensis]GLY66196.1 5-amino-6-(5-phosphoribosylamino)uracil reductase [Amycolatopsis taiwanensis]